MSDARYVVTVSALDQLILYLLTATPPPKPVWVVLERVMNNLMKDHPVHAVDTEELVRFRGECFKTATPLLEATEDLRVRTDSVEFKALFNYYLSTVITELAAAKKAEEQELSSHHTVAALTTLHMLHEMVAPALRALVTEYFEFKHKASNG